jgi:hypothetical protein
LPVVTKDMTALLLKHCVIHIDAASGAAHHVTIIFVSCDQSP